MKFFDEAPGDSISGVYHSLLAGLMGIAAHLDTCASVLAIIVLTLQARVWWLKLKFIGKNKNE